MKVDMKTGAPGKAFGTKFPGDSSELSLPKSKRRELGNARFRALLDGAQQSNPTHINPSLIGSNNEPEKKPTEQHDKEPEEAMRVIYRVYTYDNFHMYDEDDDGADCRGEYDTSEEALRAANKIVDNSLRWEHTQCKNPADSDELYSRYISFGDSPSIRPDTDPRFSASQYAKSRCAEICRAYGDKT